MKENLSWNACNVIFRDCKVWDGWKWGCRVCWKTLTEQMLSLHSRICVHKFTHAHIHTPTHPFTTRFSSCISSIPALRSSPFLAVKHPMALGPLETIKKYRLMKYRVCSGFNFMVPITANCNMANYSSPCRIASEIVSCPHQTKFQANGTSGASIEHFIILIM